MIRKLLSGTNRSRLPTGALPDASQIARCRLCIRGHLLSYASDYTSSPLTDRPSDTPPHPPLTWETLRQSWSPRPTIRVDRDGDHATYIDVPAGNDRPRRPHALYLADDRQRFHLLGFDFDAHHEGLLPRVDAAALQAFLTTAGVPHLVCASGPGEGVHVWVRLSTPATAAAVHRLATRLAGALPSFDPTPLLNPATGCLRAPGSPHRHGGYSTPLGDDIHVLPARFNDVDRALAGLAATSSSSPKRGKPAPAHRQPIDTTAWGTPHLRGARRPLSAQFRALAHKPVGIADDASAVGWSLLLACAHARYTQEDLQHAAFTDAWPGLEYLRTVRQDEHRSPLPRREQFLETQWHRAVDAAASVPAAADDIGSEKYRAAAARVAAFQQLCDSEPSRWRGCTGVVDRLLVDALCWHICQAATGTVHLSERAWALTAGLERSTVHRRLRVLVKEGWVVRARRAAGPWAAQWSLREGGGESGSGPDPANVVEALGKRLESARHDVWTARGYGQTAWLVWRAIKDGARTIRQICGASGLGRTTVSEKLAALRLARLVDGSGTRAYVGRQRLADAAEALGVRGAHADKKRLYALHSATFVWWLTDRLHDQLSGPSDALGEWGMFPDEMVVADTDPRDVGLVYGAVSHGPPPEVTTWAAAMVMQELHRHRDPDYWQELVADARTALPAAEMYGPAVLTLAA